MYVYIYYVYVNMYTYICICIYIHTYAHAASGFFHDYSHSAFVQSKISKMKPNKIETEPATTTRNTSAPEVGSAG